MPFGKICQLRVCPRISSFQEILFLWVVLAPNSNIIFQNPSLMFSLFKSKVWLFRTLGSAGGVVAGILGGKDKLLNGTEQRELVCSPAASWPAGEATGTLPGQLGTPPSSFCYFCHLGDQCLWQSLILDQGVAVCGMCLIPPLGLSFLEFPSRLIKWSSRGRLIQQACPRGLQARLHPGAPRPPGKTSPLCPEP